MDYQVCQDILLHGTQPKSHLEIKNTSKTQVEYLGTKVLEVTAPAHLSKATKIFNEGDEGASI